MAQVLSITHENGTKSDFSLKNELTVDQIAQIYMRKNYADLPGELIFETFGNGTVIIGKEYLDKSLIVIK